MALPIVTGAIIHGRPAVTTTAVGGRAPVRFATSEEIVAADSTPRDAVFAPQNILTTLLALLDENE
jgi:hypothetical protein